MTESLGQERLSVFVAGHRGMVGSAIVRHLSKDDSVKILTEDRRQLDLANQAQVAEYLLDNHIDQIYVAAAKVGGIHANNSYPADFIYENLIMEANVIHGAFKAGIKKLLFLGSSCIYPRKAAQPMQEEALLSGYLEPTNEPYAIAKIAGIKLCESFNRQYGASHGIDYRSVMPTNLFGINDNYHEQNSHVIPALIKKFHQAKDAKDSAVNVWGSGKARREFLYVDDLARACSIVMAAAQPVWDSLTTPMCSHINVGTGQDITICELAGAIREIVGFEGEVIFDESRPDGAPRKLMKSDRMRALGWRPEISITEGLTLAYTDFKERFQ